MRKMILVSTGRLTQVQTFTLQNRNDPVSDITRLAGVESVAENGGGHGVRRKKKKAKSK